MQMVKIREAFTHGLLFHKIQKRTARLGIRIELFYLVSEGDFECTAQWLDKFSDYESCLLERTDMEAIAPDHPWDDLEGLRRRYDRGDVCIGLKQGDDIVAFTWADLKECNHEPLRFDVAADEAYLYDAFTLPNFRGRGLAPYMRHQSYEHLRSMGRKKFYSISEYFNKPSVQFKQKLNASFDKLYVTWSTKSGKPHTMKLREY